MNKTFSFKSQLDIGRMGVAIAKAVIRSKYPNIRDYNDDMEMQKRGIDLWVENLGFLEIKTDSHSSDRLFFELDVMGKPGAVDRCCADYYVVLFYEERLLIMIKRAELQKWLRERWYWIKTKNTSWIKTIKSSHNGKFWSAIGIAIPRRLLEKDLDIAVLTWQEADETITGIDWKGEK